MSCYSIWPIDRTLSGATTLSQSEPGNDGNEGVLCIPEPLLSDYLMPYPGHLLWWGLPFCRDAVGVFYSPSQLDLRPLEKSGQDSFGL